MKDYWRLFKYLKPYVWPHFVVATACMLIFSSTNGAVAYLTKKIFDDIFANKDQTTLFFLPFAIIGLFAIRGVMFVAESQLTSFIGGRVLTDMRNQVHDHLQSLSLSFFHRYPTGVLISITTNDVAAASEALQAPGY